MTDWVRAYIDAWNHHSARGVAAYMATDAVFEDVALGVTLRGPDDIGKWADMIAETFSSDYSFELTSAITTESGYALEWTMRGTHDRATEQLAATGRRFELRGASVGALQAGKIRENRDYYNFAEFLTQVGLMAEPAEAVASSP
jgi:steroid delta-isomerase-like uncharacterized protein